MSRMWEQATQRGANAIIGCRFDTGEIAAQFSEVCCYGTAVAVVPIAEGEPGATPQSIADALSVIVDGSVDNIYDKIGTQFKVRDFYNKLYDPSNARAAVARPSEIGFLRVRLV